MFRIKICLSKKGRVGLGCSIYVGIHVSSDRFTVAPLNSMEVAFS